MSKTFSLGIIGAGMYGKVLARAFRKDPRCQLRWVCSASEATTKAAASEFGLERWTTDYREVLADPEVDAIALCTPPYLHLEQFKAAVAAGKHIALEKPMANTLEATRSIAAIAAQSPGLVLVEASCRHARLQPKYRHIKSLIDSGKLGTVYHIHHRALARGTFIEWNKAGAWAMNRALAGGGPFIDWGVYDLSFHLGLLGDKAQLITLNRFTRNGLRDMSKWVDFTDIEQHGAAWMQFEGGLSYYYERGAGVHGETACETVLYGTKGGLRFQFPSWDSNRLEYFYEVQGEPRKEEILIDMSRTQSDDEEFASHFLDCLEGKASPEMPIERAAKHLEILYKILEPNPST